MPIPKAVLRRDPEWAAPLLWRSELLNVLALYVRQKEMPLDQAIQLVQAGETLIGGREYRVSPTHVLDLAATSRCTAYDCEFVALSRDLNLPLVTVDPRLMKAFPETTVSLAGFVDS